MSRTRLYIDFKSREGLLEWLEEMRPCFREDARARKVDALDAESVAIEETFILSGSKDPGEFLLPDGTVGPLDRDQEAGAPPMSPKAALELLIRSIAGRENIDNRCHCNSCYVCAYRTLKAAVEEPARSLIDTIKTLAETGATRHKFTQLSSIPTSEWPSLINEQCFWVGPQDSVVFGRIAAIHAPGSSVRVIADYPQRSRTGGVYVATRVFLVTPEGSR